MRKSLFILLLPILGFVLSACHPRGVLSEDEMVDVLYDLHHAEAVLQISGYAYGHDDAVAKYNYEVLASHGVTQAQFDSSLTWYTNHPLFFERIYPKVMARMEADLKESEK